MKPFLRIFTLPLTSVSSMSEGNFLSLSTLGTSPDNNYSKSNFSHLLQTKSESLIVIF